MVEDVFETIVKGSNTIFLNVPENDYFYSYNSISKKHAQDLTEHYFKEKDKEGVPKVKNIDLDSNTHRVNIAVEIQREMGKRFIYE